MVTGVFVKREGREERRGEENMNVRIERGEEGRI